MSPPSLLSADFLSMELRRRPDIVTNTGRRNTFATVADGKVGKFPTYVRRCRNERNEVVKIVLAVTSVFTPDLRTRNLIELTQGSMRSLSISFAIRHQIFETNPLHLISSQPPSYQQWQIKLSLPPSPPHSPLLHHSISPSSQRTSSARRNTSHPSMNPHPNHCHLQHQG